MINISINLSKLPKEKMTTSKTGDKWINLSVNDLKELDKFGNSHSVTVQQTKEEREAKTPKVYVGNGKEFKFDQPKRDIHQQGVNNYNHTPNQVDDLPF